MGRRTSFLGSGKTIAASSVITFNGNDLPSAGVTHYHLVTTAASNTFANIFSRLRLKADSKLIVDVGPAHFRKWLERMSQNNYAMPTGVNRLTIPLNLMDIVDDDMADICQFPRGAVPTLELTTTASAVAGVLLAGWTQNDEVKASLFPTLLGSAMNVGNGQVNAQYPFSTAGAIRGAIVTTTGLNRFQMEVGGTKYHDLAGPNYNGLATGDMMLESQSLEDGAGSSGGVTITSEACLRIPDKIATGGNSRLILDTGTYATANELTLWTTQSQS